MLLPNIAIFLRFLSISYCFQEIYIMLEVIIFPLYNIINYVLHYWVINKMKIVNFGNTWYKTALGQDQSSGEGPVMPLLALPLVCPLAEHLLSSGFIGFAAVGGCFQVWVGLHRASPGGSGLSIQACSQKLLI